MSKDTSGPAFPVMDTSQNQATGETHVYQSIESGMTLRDYFAAKAMQSTFITLERYDQFKTCADAAYRMADEMLEARRK